MKLIVLVASLTLMTVNAFAVAPLVGVYEFDCGKVMNVTRTLVVSSDAPGTNSLGLVGEYVTAGPDKVTGMLSQIKVSLNGQMDLLALRGTKETPVLYMVGVKDPLFQVIAELPTAEGQVVNAAEVHLKTNDQTKFKCKLVSVK